jgi:hypothetical protein
MAKVKGTAVEASVAYLKGKLGEDGFARLVDGLPETEKAVFKNRILESLWYDFDAVLALMKAAKGKVDLPPGRSLAWDMGRASADRGMNTVYRMFFKFADVSFICKRAASLYPALYNSGEMRLLANDAKSAALSVTGFDQPCPEFCDRALGWVERTLELTGAKGIRVDHPTCVVRGDARCEYRGRWE